MHRSRLGGMIIDCATEDLEAAAAFWGQALGLEWETPEDPAASAYRTLRTAPEEPYLEVQRVSHDSRVHLDIETDDLEAEVARLVELGAKRVGAVRDWVVMEAPTGQRFCVVPAVRAGFERNARVWD